jgi:hypothetical protein
MGSATVTPLSTSAPIAAKLLIRDGARRIAVNFAKLAGVAAPKGRHRPAPPQPWPPMRSTAPAELMRFPNGSDGASSRSLYFDRTEAFAQPE